MEWSGRARRGGLALLAGLVLCPAQGLAQPLATPRVTHRGLASLTLGLELDRAIGQRVAGNQVSSPLGLQEAFGMLSAGARGRTLDQIVSGLQLAPAGRPLLSTLSRMAADLRHRTAAGPVRLTVANAVWAQAGLPLGASFQTALDRLFGAPPAAPDFRGDPAGAERLINAWAAKATDGQITQVYAPGSLPAATRMVLTDAIDLDAPWLYPFDPSHSAARAFHRLDGSTGAVPTMEADRLDIPYAHGARVQAVELPYADRRLSMVLLVPDRGRFAQVTRTLSAAGVEGLLGRLRTTSVRLVMPKLSITARPPLADVLRSLGVRDAFDAAHADFSGITPGRGFALTAPRQVVTLRVGELGTQAAAVTSGGLEVTSIPRTKVSLSVDRPFLFLIRDRATGTVVFLGRVLDPGTVRARTTPDH